MNTSNKAFEELCKKEYDDDYPVICGKLDILFVWNAAIDEAVKVVTKELPDEIDEIRIANKIKELKE